ncbi:MAG: hypothetical protein QOE08_808 [Thermoleophilaceae bacterium]|jgi:hypothetical protein|nr:hypothetical protein [Thermoleophilaceae bacterium]
MGARDWIRRRVTFANVVSLIALFVALGGTSYAAITITGKNVKNGSLTGKDIQDGSVGTLDVKNGGLLAKDFKAGQLPKGPKGDNGLNGTNGTSGANGATNVVLRQVETPFTTAGANAEVPCAAGERATGGGSSYSTNGVGVAKPVVLYSRPVTNTPPYTTPDTWEAAMRNDDGATGEYELFVYVVCASP